MESEKQDDLLEINFLPVWSKTGTVTELESRIIGFKFEGPGWYFRKDGPTDLVTLAVGMMANRPFANPSLWPMNARFTLHHWYKNPMCALKAILNAPIRVDNR